MHLSKEEFWQYLTICTDPRSFVYDTNKKTIKIELPILPENIKYFRKSIFSMIGNPEKPVENWENDPLFHGYKIDSRYISIDCKTIQYNRLGQLEVSNENITDIIEDKVLDKLGIDISNDEINICSFPGLSEFSHSSFAKKEINYSYSNEGLNYKNPDNWYLFPKYSSGLLDVFIIYPTTVYNLDKKSIIDTSDMEMLQKVNKFLKIIIPIFKDLPVNLYMPKYRQYNGLKIDEYSLDWYKSNSIESVHDIYNAFAYFLNECQGADKFITFSQDQGSILNYLLATDFISKIPIEIKNKWVNIWAFGEGLDETVLSNTSFIASGLPNDINTIISWNLSSESEISKNRKTWGNGTSVCVNPITFTKSYEEKSKLDNISLIEYYDNNIFQIKNSITAKIISNSFGNEIIKINQEENNILTDQQIEKRDENNFGYFYNNTIGLFVENIRNNIISRYSLFN
jgi:hypothetical protein